LGGVDFGAGGGVVGPEEFLVGRDEGDAELVGEEDVAVGEEDGVADFAFARGVDVGPGDLSFFDDELESTEFQAVSQP
jgi:hypothetical protein